MGKLLPCETSLRVCLHLSSDVWLLARCVCLITMLLSCEPYERRPSILQCAGTAMQRIKGRLALKLIGRPWCISLVLCCWSWLLLEAVLCFAGKTMENELEVVEGMKFDRGYISPYFVTDPKTMKAELDSPLILVVEKKISGYALPDTINKSLQRVYHSERRGPDALCLTAKPAAVLRGVLPRLVLSMGHSHVSVILCCLAHPGSVTEGHSSAVPEALLVASAK